MTGRNLPEETVQMTKQAPVFNVGCVSYLNSKPLIEGLAETGAAKIDFRVPAMLLEGLESGELDIALCPVVDYFRSATDLAIIPSGGIACAGNTLTVRLFSQVPLAEVTAVHADVESHTSVALMQILMKKLYQKDVEVIPYNAGDHACGSGVAEKPETILLIGDKVVSSSPCGCKYTHQLDLGQAWWELTGKPFVFAVWMARKGHSVGRLPELLTQIQRYNDMRIDELAETFAPKHVWPISLAKQYLSEILHYTLGKPEFEGIKLFAQYAEELQLIEKNKPLCVLAGRQF